MKKITKIAIGLSIATAAACGVTYLVKKCMTDDTIEDYFDDEADEDDFFEDSDADIEKEFMEQSKEKSDYITIPPKEKEETVNE